MSNPTPDQLPPHSTEAESGTLGCCLLDPANIDALHEAGVTERWFYDLGNQSMFHTLLGMRSRQDSIDLVTFGQRLADAQKLGALGGLTAIATLLDAAPCSSNLAYWLPILRDKFLLRQLLSTCTEIIQRVREVPEHGPADVPALLDDSERDLLAIRDSSLPAEDEQTPKMRAASFVDRLQERCATSAGIPTGFSGLDRAMGGGLREGNLIVIAARPSMGKSALAMSIATNVARSTGPVGVISLEMSVEELQDRIVSSDACVNTQNVTPHSIPNEADCRRLTLSNTRSSNDPVWIDATPSMTVGAIKAKARRWKRRGIRLLVIDYLQLIKPEGGRKRDRQEEVGEISRNLKILAKQLKLPVIALCQLNRDIEKEKARLPRLSDLRESGSIEQDADVVGMLYEASDPKQRDQSVQSAQMVNLLLAKQRSGRRGAIVEFRFLGQFTRFDELTRQEQP